MHAPILVLALGNTLLTDDGVGARVLELLASELSMGDSLCELVDGGTRGMALLGLLSDRRAVLILDAVAHGAEPGVVHVIRDRAAAVSAAPPAGLTAHEGNAGELLRAAMLLGDLPEHVIIIGVEPGRLQTGFGLTPAVEEGARGAAARAAEILRELSEILAKEI